MGRMIPWRAAKERAEEQTQSGPPQWRLKLPWPNKKTTAAPRRRKTEYQGKNTILLCWSPEKSWTADTTSSHANLENLKPHTPKSRASSTYPMSTVGIESIGTSFNNSIHD
uniref:Uncharacterized protein n=1 Tax=Oryza barthii TaxID=65489 RepID=A0A0D3H938_9ORYZ